MSTRSLFSYRVLMTLMAIFLAVMPAIPLSLAYGQSEPLKPNSITALTIRSSKFSPAEASAAEHVSLLLEIELASGYHAYLDQFRLESVDPSGIDITIQHIQPVVEFHDKFSKRVRQGIEGRAELAAVLPVPKSLPAGKNMLEFDLTYQACSKDFCLLPKHIKFTTPLYVSGNATAATPAHNAAGFIESAVQEGWLSVLWKVFIAGILASFTPCIYPMIPITLAVLGAHGSARSRRASFVLSLIYVSGIALTYALLGLIAAFTGTLFGSLLGHPAVGVIFALLFFALALSMYGLFDIQAPLILQQKLLSIKGRSGILGAFVAGLIAGVVASPCVGPVLAGILAYAAKTQNVWQGFTLLLFFALGMGQLFIVLGTFGHMVALLPKSGRWMNAIKFTFGTAMLALGMYYLRPVVSPMVFSIILGLLTIGVSVYFGLVKTTFGHRVYAFTHRLLGAVGVIIGVVFVLQGLPTSWRASLGLSSEHQSEPVASLPWQNYSESALEGAARSGKAVVIDFVADWCAACKELEAETFSAASVQALRDSFVFLRFDATSTTPEFEKLQQKYGIVGLPFVGFYDQRGNWRPELTLTGFEEAPEFTKRMKSALGN